MKIWRDRERRWRLTEASCLGLGARGITVDAISPTIVDTEVGRRVWAGEPGEDMKLRIPTGRFAQPEEIALAALYLASGAAGMINDALHEFMTGVAAP